MTKFEAWGLTGTVATQLPEFHELAVERLHYWLDEFDRSCNRFKPDSEISRLNSQPARALPISATFERALDAAFEASEVTGGLCDPTVLPALLALGYDRDYSLLAGADVPASAPVPAMGVGAIDFDRAQHCVTLAPHCQLDLGASAKALVVDLVASDLAPRCGVVVELGGDVAVRGRGPDGPWAIGISDSLAITGREPRVTLAYGGVATSSSTTRTWRANGRVVNHLIDPRTGACASGPYATASVAAKSCVVANAFSTAALLWGEDAGYYISQAGWSGRLVRHDGTVEFVGGWPQEEIMT